MSTSDFYAQLDMINSPLNNFALSLTRDLADSRDLFQDTVYKALKNKDKFKIGTNFKAWILTLMRNTFINDYRKKKRSKVKTVADDSIEMITDTRSAAANEGESNMAMQELMAMLDELDPKLSEPFWMNYQGMSYQEVADALETPLGTIKSRIFFARKEMQEKVLRAGLR
jgi:RNA polymerase sigma-70 factor (ECF subfamily)